MRESFCVPNEWLWKTLFMYWNLLYKALYRYRVGRLTGGYIAKWWLKLFDRLATRFNDQTICHVWAEIFVYFIYTVSGFSHAQDTHIHNQLHFLYKIDTQIKPTSKTLGGTKQIFQNYEPFKYNSFYVPEIVSESLFPHHLTITRE